MVKKIGGPKTGSRATSTTPVQATKTVQSGKVSNVDQIKRAEKQKGAGKVMAPTTELSAEMREKIMQMIDEEADKMFGKTDLPEDKKASVKGAVKMAIGAGILEEEEN